MLLKKAVDSRKKENRPDTIMLLKEDMGPIILLEDVDSNYADHFNHAVAKFVAGKKINYTVRRSYESRCQSAVAQHNIGMAQHKLKKTMFGTNPGDVLKNLSDK
ncbi:hypothetical protein PR048_008616 [Dryococelus australis]|uniref:Uncharacterized protein n=1 Tax=Dryococelus australis TaxID=614101 RepID=A0ABQ9HXK7_9NEOP|nr:hypothetical protein PR048_008616 [Dryococelus australis]